MKILLANKFYYIKGGAERYYFDLKNLLERKGHWAIPFSMEDERNFKSEYSKYFVSNVELGKPSFSARGAFSAGRILYSFEARKKMEELIKKEKPDIAHINNIYHQISPSILTVLKKHKIPVVQTLHDYKIICPIYILYSKNEICEHCKKYRYYMTAVRKCTKNSRAASLINLIELYLHKFLRIYENNVDMFIAPSNFLRNKILEWKMLGPEKIVLMPNFVDVKGFLDKTKLLPERSESEVEGKFTLSKNFTPRPAQGIKFLHSDYLLYFGRLSHEKGLKTLVSAMKFVKNGKLLIAGTGPEEKKLKEYAKKENIKNIEFLGYLKSEDLKRVIQKCLFTVLPSVFYEPFGLTILESYAYGKAVLGSNLGAIPEVVKNGETGLVFESENVKDLADKINLMLADKAKTIMFGEEGRKMLEYKYMPEQYYKKLIKIYESVRV
jgi:glycosyltransferase involved in cell wall biosynthesis